MRQSALGFSPEATYPTSWSRPVMDVSLAWLELDMRTVLGSRAIGARGCRRRGGTITARPPPGVATRGMEWPDRVVIGPDCCRSRGFGFEIGRESCRDRVCRYV